MKEKVQVCKYENSDSDYDEIIRLHKLIFKNTALDNKLIYFDAHFEVFFKNVILDSKHNALTVLKIDDKIAGFIHFKIIEDTLFLNNICIDSGKQGSGLGKYFLKESLNYYKDSEMKNFILDVFSKNVKALQWYEKLGLKIISETKWTQILHSQETQFTSDTYLKNDENGFKSVYADAIKIATVVNDKNLVIHKMDYAKQIALADFDTVITNQNADGFQTVLLDNSYRMKELLKNVIKNLTDV